MASGNMQQPLKTYMSYCVHIRVLDSHQELCYKKDHVLPCPLVGCLRTRSTASPLGQASILKGGNGLYQGLVQSVPNFPHHWFTSQMCSLSTHITRGDDQTKSGTRRWVYNSWVRCLSHLEKCLKKCLNRTPKPITQLESVCPPSHKNIPTSM